MAYKDEIAKTEIPTFAELFEFRSNQEVLYLTSYPKDITINAVIYTSCAIMREEFTKTKESRIETVISIATVEDISLRFLLEDITSIKVIIKRYFIELDVIKSIFAGYVESIGVQNRVVSLKVVDILSFGSSVIPKIVYSALCNNTLYDSVCGVQKGNYKVEAVVQEQERGTILYSSTFESYPDDWFTYGFVIYKNAQRMITKHIGGYLYLHAPFSTSVNNQTVAVYPGCDKSPQTCKNKFNNFNNFVGFPYIPSKNPVIWGL